VSRNGVAIVLVLLGCLLAGPAVAAYSLDRQMADQTRYVTAVTPIADSPAVRTEVTNRVTETISARILPGDLQLPAAARDAVHDVVTKVVDTNVFRTGWVKANEIAYPDMLAVLRGDSSRLRIEDDTVLLDLGVLAQQAKAKMIEAGIPFAGDLPDIEASIRLFSRPAIRQAIPAFGLLQDLSTVLPIVAAALILLGLLIGARRRRALITTGLGLAVSMLLVLLYQWIGRNQLITRSKSPELAGAFYDAFTGDLIAILWVVFGVGIVLTIVGLAVRSRPKPVAAGPRIVAPRQ
jgi:hypothetical protein